MHQVIVVGAGPAGAHLAYLLAREGIDVLLLEKERLPRYKPCAGGVAPKARRFLDFDLSPVIEDTVRTVVLAYHKAEPITATRDQSVVYTVSRDRFDAFIVNKAKEAGVEVREGARVRQVEACNSGILVHAGGREWPGQILVGADGAQSVVARALGMVRRKITAVTLTKEVPVSGERLERSRGTIKVNYGKAPGTITWVFPKVDRLSIGAGTISPRFKGLHPFLQQMTIEEGLAEPAAMTRARGWTIPYNPKPDLLHHGRALVVGDAAGLADPLTGEGIYAALLSARLAAEVIADQVKKPRPDLSYYTGLVRKKMMPEMLIAYKVSRLFHLAPGVFHGILQHRRDLAAGFIALVAGDITYAEFFNSLVRWLPATLLTAVRNRSLPF